MRKQIVIKNQAGQSLIEIVFSIGIIALVVTASVILIVNAVGVKTNGFERKKATEMAEIVMEDLVNQKRNDGNDFWSLSSKAGETLPTFTGYNYSIGYNTDGIGCSGCVNAVITINWGDAQILEVSRFFSKVVN